MTRGKYASAFASDPGQGPGELSRADADFFRNQICRLAGISLRAPKIDLIRNRVAPRAQALGLSGIREYRELLETLGPGHPEWQELVNLLTTNKTAWFREPSHFEDLARIARERDRPLRVWCAASSTGEEAYSLAMALEAALSPGARYRIEATDVDTEVLDWARNGVYRKAAISEVPARHRSWLVPGTEEIADWMKIRRELKEKIGFSVVNLMAPVFPWKEPFDVIFCRNVLIYFDLETVQEVAKKLFRAAADGATLFIGHSESLSQLATGWRQLAPTLYRKGNDG